MWFDPFYFVFIGPALLLAAWASWKVHQVYAKDREIGASSGYSDAETIIVRRGLVPVRAEPPEGFCSDHYDPGSKVLRLSPEVHAGRSLAALGVAAHDDTSTCATPAPKGRLARLREIARTGGVQVVDGIEVSPQLAEMMVAVHDGLAPHEQEVFAAYCNADFLSCVRACAASHTALPLAGLLVHILRSANPTHTGSL